MCRLAGSTPYDVTCSFTESEMNPKNIMQIAAASSMRSNSSKRTLAVALAEKFLWQIFLTEEWDYVFKSDRVPKFPIMPHKLSFVPTLVVWRDDQQVSGDDKLVVYSEPAANGTVILGMMKVLDDGIECWYPNSVSFEIAILDAHKARACGTSMLVIPPIKVWHLND